MSFGSAAALAHFSEIQGREDHSPEPRGCSLRPSISLASLQKANSSAEATVLAIQKSDPEKQGLSNQDVAATTRLCWEVNLVYQPRPPATLKCPCASQKSPRGMHFL